MTINYLARKPEQKIQDAGMRLAIELERARYSIWIANIWITNNELFELLIDKAKQGLNVEIILDKGVWMDCEDLHKLQRFIDAGGEFYLTKELENAIDLNGAFCLIDNSVAVDHVSDNQSYKRHGYSNYFMREYPETLVDHYINEYFSVKKKYCVNRYS
jgi:ornithine carbamoyltransferase